MCLIFTNTPSDVPLSDAWLNDFYSHNRDGWGFMWWDAATQTTKVHKAMGTANQWIADFRDMEAKQVEFATHLRMRTHGATDLENVHPYNVAENLELMHNGILSTGYGSSGDKTKSDTWHYIRDYFHPLLKHMPAHTLFSTPMQSLIGDSIGNNRFVVMAPEGVMVIINEDQGVDWHGRWMSNTYAWAADLKQLPDQAPIVRVPYQGTFGKKASTYAPAYTREDLEGWGLYGSMDMGSTKVSPKGDLVKSNPDFDAIDAALDAQEAELAAAEADMAPPQSDNMLWMTFLELVEEKYDLKTSLAVDYLYTQVYAHYTPAEIDTADVDWHGVTKWLYENDACSLAELLSDMVEGYSLDSLIEQLFWAKPTSSVALAPAKATTTVN